MDEGESGMMSPEMVDHGDISRKKKQSFIRDERRRDENQDDPCGRKRMACGRIVDRLVSLPSSSSLVVRGRPMNEAPTCLPSIQPHPLAGTMAGRCMAAASLAH